MTGSFSEEALAQVEAMFAEGQKNPLEGECNQQEKRKAAKKPRSPEQAQADKARSQAAKGGANRGNRSEAAKKAAQTRAKCKQGSRSVPTPATPQPGFTGQ